MSESQMESHHPGSAVLGYLAKAGTPTITGLKDYLKRKGAPDSMTFLKKLATDEWFFEYGWKLVPHPILPNKLQLVRDNRKETNEVARSRL